MLKGFLKLFEKKCNHYGSRTTFKDIHMGDRWYVRGYINCRDCGYRKCVAIPLPDSLDFRNLDLEKYWDEVRSGEYS